MSKRAGWIGYQLGKSPGALQRATGIPAAVFTRIQSGRSSPTSNTLSKLHNAYRRETYNALRKSGLSRNEARRLQGARPEKAFKIADKTLVYAKEIAKGNDVALDVVLKGMRQSTRLAPDWEEYVRQRKRERWANRYDPKTKSVYGPHILRLSTYKDRGGAYEH